VTKVHDWCHNGVDRPSGHAKRRLIPALAAVSTGMLMMRAEMTTGEKPIRKQLSKKTRFEIFKRDIFTCQYCGAHPPGVILHVDHIKPVADGGTNVIDNLVTACEPCNAGKGARLLSAVPQTLAEKAKAIAEREEQLRGYQAILEDRLERQEDELWRVADVIETGSAESGMRRDWTASIRRFNERLGVHETLEAANMARGRHPYGGKRMFLYFCGICWNRIREKEAIDA
jgi:HNH endonuclease